MRRKKFLKVTSAAVATGVLSPLISCKEKSKLQQNEMDIKGAEIRKNWAGNYTYKAPGYFEPDNIDMLIDHIRQHEVKKALGSTHCFNNIADSPGHQISMQKLNRIVELDKENKTVIIEGGMKYGELAPELDKAGLALHNLASLPHISVAGAAATATHGSGVTNGNLATAVIGLELADGRGEIHMLNSGDPDFNGVVVGLGAFGIITRLKLKLQDKFNVSQEIYQDLPLGEVSENFASIMGSGYSVSLFTDWQNNLVSQVWIKRKVEEGMSELGESFYGGKKANIKLHPIVSASPVHCTEQLGAIGPWYDRLPHFKMGFTPSSGEELQSEYFVPAENAVEAFLALEKMKDIIYPELMISEIRTIARDDFWLSTSYGQDSVAFHFTWKPNWEGVKEILPLIEDTLAPFNVRPHWGKLFTLPSGFLHQRYDKMKEFIELVQKYDPNGFFRNEFLDHHIFGKS